jgi:hypothetical protein
MTRDEAIQAAHRFAATCDVRLGKCLFEYQHPRTMVWVFFFAVIESKPEWGWYCALRDDGAPTTLVAMKRPTRFMGV